MQYKQMQAETELTPEMISSGSWKEVSFKPYNFDALGISPEGTLMLQCNHQGLGSGFGQKPDPGLCTLN